MCLCCLNNNARIMEPSARISVCVEEGGVVFRSLGKVQSICWYVLLILLLNSGCTGHRNDVSVCLWKCV